MAYRFDGTDPFLLASIGAFSGYGVRNNPLSGAVLLKRNGNISAWNSIHVIDNGGATNYAFVMEFDTANQLAADITTANPLSSAATFNNTTDWMILGFCWDGTNTAGAWVWRWKIGSNAWSSETDTSGTNASTAGSGYRHRIGTEAAGGDDANYDMVCIGLTKSTLSQGTFESLNMTQFSTWQSVFTGAGAWLLGFETISSQTDRTGNGGNETSRSGGITLVSDPPSWVWGGPATKTGAGVIGP
jgi:hypothetical protein